MPVSSPQVSDLNTAQDESAIYERGELTTIFKKDLVGNEAAIAALRKWRFQPGDMKRIKIPMDFWMNGSGVRHRMSGAVISD